MNYLLDTCVVSELIKPKAAPAVLRWVGGQEENGLYLSVITLGEIRKGIAKLGDARRVAKLESWLEQDLRERFQGRILAINDEIAITWGRLQGQAEKREHTLPVLDGLIAATALHHRLTVVTRNGRDMQASGALIIDPWQG